MFEILVSILLISLAYIKHCDLKSLVFVFGTLALLGISIGLTQQRKYRSLPLALLLVWGFAITLLTADRLPQESIVLKYINTYILLNGLMFLFSGVILLKLIVDFSKRVWMYYPTLLIISLPWLDFALRYKQITILASFIVSALIICIWSKRYLLFSLISIVSSVFTLQHWSYIQSKWSVRPLIFKHLVYKISEYPLIGRGFVEGFVPHNMEWIKPSNYGWAWICNDYLNFGARAGLLALGLVVLWVFTIIKNVKGGFLRFLALGLAIVPFFQATMFNIYKASVYILLISIIIIRGRLCYTSSYSLSVLPNYFWRFLTSKLHRKIK